MVQNPKYDNDAVNLGYLNKRLKQSEKDITTDNNNSISKIPKNYSIPPNPPYYKDSLLCYKNKIYKCNTTKLSGVFSWNDWSIAATDDTTVSDFINNIYELEKLEIQEQIDGKIQTYYQETDPSNEWKTDLEKAKHIGDYWYNTTNNTQWRYNRNTDTTPITYGWGQVNVPNSVFDLIDKKKSIYTIKPTSYKKDDLWIIEDTLSNEDLPTGTEENPIAKGDWVFSVANSDTYNKEHWVKRDEDVSLSYLEQHYYTMGDIDSSFEELERSTDSKITKAKEEINLNVSQKYTTIEAHKAAINNFDEQIGTINNTIKTHETNISDLNVGVGKISASVESVKSKTEELSVDIDGVKENIIPTSTVSGPNIHIEDASDKKMVNFEIEGKSEQATRSGKNLFNKNATYSYSNVPSSYNTITEKSTGITYSSTYPNGTPFIVFKSVDLTNYVGKTVRMKATTSGSNGGYRLILTNEDLTSRIKKDETYSSDIEISFVVPSIDELGDTKYLGICFMLTGTGNATREYSNVVVTIDNENMTYEDYGVSPSPDYPSEIESVGYENIWDEQWELGLYSISDGSKADSTTNIRSKNYIPCFPNKNYYLKANVGNRVCFYDINKNFISIEFDKQNTVFKTPSNCYYMTFNLGSAYGTTYKNDVAIFKGNKERNYIPYGKYEIKVKNTGKNLFNKNGLLSDGYLASTGEFGGGSRTWKTTDYIPIKPNEIITTSGMSNPGSNPSRCYYDKNKVFISGLKHLWTNPFTEISPQNAYYMRESIAVVDLDTCQIEEKPRASEYEPYKSNTTLIVLNQQLRSLPNGVKDIAYIKNNILYVDRKVGSKVFDGSENWTLYPAGTDKAYKYYTSIDDCKTGLYKSICSHFKNLAYAWDLGNVGDYSDHPTLNYKYFVTDKATVEEFKTWLSTNNTQVDYELAEPYTETIGEVEIPSTFKGVNNITTTDELEPVMNIEYVRDTILSDYVEGQVGNAVAIQERKNAEFQITNEEIKSSVSNISTDLDGTKSSLNSVEEKITSQEKTINIISKNIDGTTGDIREVTTTTGFKFNAEGMTIDDGAGYKAQHTAQGTFYKDGDSITGQYTKDGSKQKDLEHIVMVKMISMILQCL